MKARSILARQYARAAFDIALEKEQIDEWQPDLLKAAQLVHDDTITAYLEDPKTNLGDKVKLLSRRKSNINPLVLNLVYLLLYKDRLDILPAIAEEYQHLLDDYHGVARAEVVTATPLDDKNRSILNEMLADITGKSVIINNRVNPVILGGIVVNVEGKRLDGSLISRLAALKSQVVKVSRDRAVKEGI